MPAGAEAAGYGIRARLTLAIVGVAYGILTSAVNHGLGPGAAYVSKVLGSGLIWLAAGMLACLGGRTWWFAFLRGITFFLPAVVAYYLSDVAAGVYISAPVADPLGPPRFDLTNLVSDVGSYALISAVTSGVLAVLVVLIHRGGILGVFAAAAVPGYIAVSALSLERRQRTGVLAADPLLAQVSWFIGAAALAVAVGVVVIRVVTLISLSGRALALAPLDRGGTADLVIGAPGDSVGGSFTVLLGSAAGLTTNWIGGTRYTQATPGIPSTAERADAFGLAVSAGFVQSRTQATVVVSAPGEDVGRIVDAGSITQIPIGAAGPDPGAARTITADTPGVQGRAAVNDFLGGALAMGG